VGVSQAENNLNLQCYSGVLFLVPVFSLRLARHPAQLLILFNHNYWAMKVKWNVYNTSNSVVACSFCAQHFWPRASAMFVQNSTPNTSKSKTQVTSYLYDVKLYDNANSHSISRLSIYCSLLNLTTY